MEAFHRAEYFGRILADNFKELFLSGASDAYFKNISPPRTLGAF